MPSIARRAHLGQRTAALCQCYDFLVLCFLSYSLTIVLLDLIHILHTDSNDISDSSILCNIFLSLAICLPPAMRIVTPQGSLCLALVYFCAWPFVIIPCVIRGRHSLCFGVLTLINITDCIIAMVTLITQANNERIQQLRAREALNVQNHELDLNIGKLLTPKEEDGAVAQECCVCLEKTAFELRDCHHPLCTTCLISMVRSRVHLLKIQSNWSGDICVSCPLCRHEYAFMRRPLPSPPPRNESESSVEQGSGAVDIEAQ